MTSISFLLCSERSGSNFVIDLLNRHSQISGPATKHLINPAARNLFRYKINETNSNWEALIRDFINLFNVPFSEWQTNVSFEELAQNIPQNRFDLLINYVFTKEAQGKPNSIIKEIAVHEFFPFLLSKFPESIYLHQVRDPRDMALSWKKSPVHVGGIVNAAKQWKVDQQKYLAFGDLVGFDTNAFLIKYEDLIKSPESTLTPFLNQLNVEWEDRMLKANKKSIEKSAKQEAWSNLSKPIMQNNSNKFTEELTAKEIALVEKICSNEMQFLGYELYSSESEREEISSGDLNAYDQYERQEIEYVPSKGVKANMLAKKRFYEFNV